MLWFCILYQVGHVIVLYFIPGWTCYDSVFYTRLDMLWFCILYQVGHVMVLYFIPASQLAGKVFLYSTNIVKYLSLTWLEC